MRILETAGHRGGQCGRTRSRKRYRSRQKRLEVIEVAPSVKFTVPVGAKPLTVAVRVRVAPTVAGLAELAKRVVVAALFTT